MRLIKILLIIVLPLLVNCSGLYPINHRLVEANIQDVEGYRIAVDHKDFYQLRVTEKVDFIPVNSGNGDTLVSDLPYRSFQQDVTKQDSIYFGGPLTIEEVYMYLDGINSKNEAGKDAQYGYILYFVTYAAVDGNLQKSQGRKNSKVRKYFNDPEKLYINTVRDIFVGYWVKNSKDELLLFFQIPNGTINVHHAFHKKDRIGLAEVAHPNKNNWRIGSYNRINRLINFNSLSERGNKPVKDVDRDELDLLFQNVYKNVSLISLDNVFDLNGEKELLFINIPQDKEFVLEKRGKRGVSEFFTIEEMVLQNPRLFVKTKKDKESIPFQFKTKHVDFRTPQ